MARERAFEQARLGLRVQTLPCCTCCGPWCHSPTHPPRSHSVLWPLSASPGTWQHLRKWGQMVLCTTDVFWRKSVLHARSHSKLTVILASHHLDGASTLCQSLPRLLLISLPPWNYCPHSIDQELEAQSRHVTCSRTPSWEAMGCAPKEGPGAGLVPSLASPIRAKGCPGSVHLPHLEPIGTHWWCKWLASCIGRALRIKNAHASCPGPQSASNPCPPGAPHSGSCCSPCGPRASVTLLMLQPVWGQVKVVKIA